MAMQKLFKKVLEKKQNNFKASFHCVLTLKWYDIWLKTFSGKISGEIIWPPKGKNGFGYDPFFVPSNFTETFGEMIHTKKILLDHRYIAFKKLAKSHLIGS